MAKMRKTSISIKLESDASIGRKINQAIFEVMEDAFRKVAKTLISKFRPILVSAIQTQPEFFSLKNGILRWHLGVPDEGKIDKIVEIWANSFKVESFNPAFSGRSFKGGLRIVAVPGNYDDVLSDISAFQSTAKGETLHWLEWLLLEGDKKIIRQYDVKLGKNKASRTGNAVMVKSQKSWGVPSIYAGTSENNWVTRAINSIGDSEIIDIIQSELNRVI